MESKYCDYPIRNKRFTRRQPLEPLFFYQVLQCYYNIHGERRRRGWVVSKERMPGRWYRWISPPSVGDSSSQRVLSLRYESIKKNIQPYVELMRLEKPIGSWLLFWPGAWSMAMASYAQQQSLNWRLLLLFGAGSIVMRGAGCTINDLWDRRIDSLVERTKSRPLAAGTVKPRQALIFLGGQLTIGLTILLQLNWPAIGLGILSLLPVILYPLMKRITYWPQLVLGFTFNWGTLLGWAAQTGTLEPKVVLPLYLAGISWTIVYDTIYALQDITDDLQAGVKSTAILFGENVKSWLAGFAAISIGGLVYAGVQNGMGLCYHAGVIAAIGHYSWQIFSLRQNNIKDCLYKFRSNRWLGGLIFVGIVGDIFLQQLSQGIVSFIFSSTPEAFFWR